MDIEIDEDFVNFLHSSDSTYLPAKSQNNSTSGDSDSGLEIPEIESPSSLFDAPSIDSLMSNNSTPPRLTATVCDVFQSLPVTTLSVSAYMHTSNEGGQSLAQHTSAQKQQKLMPVIRVSNETLRSVKCNRIALAGKQVPATCTLTHTARAPTTPVSTHSCVLPKPRPASRPRRSADSVRKLDLKIRNRMSSLKSRERKRSQFASLTQQVLALRHCNVCLQSENTYLRQRVTQLEAQVATGRSQWSSSCTLTANTALLPEHNATTSSHLMTNRKSISLCAVLLFVGMNLLYSPNSRMLVTPNEYLRDAHLSISHRSPESLRSKVSRDSSSKRSNYLANDLTRRKLLWISDTRKFSRNNSHQITSDSIPIFPSVRDILINASHSEHGVAFRCLDNQSDTERLSLLMEGLFPKDDNIRTPDKRFTTRRNHRETLALHSGSRRVERVLSYSRKQQQQQKSAFADQRSQGHGARQQRGVFDLFLGAIGRQPDRIYVVSFDQQHLVLPALEHNRTARPRITLLLPARAFNQGFNAPDKYVPMVQIDCYIMDAKILHIHERKFPLFTANVSRTADKSLKGMLI